MSDDVPLPLATATGRPVSAEAGVRRAWDAVRSGRAREVLASAEERLSSCATDPPRLATWVEAIAWAHLEEGEERDALALARRMPPGFAPSRLLAARLLLAEGKVDDGFRALEAAYVESTGDTAALVLAAAWIQHRRPDRAEAILRGLRGTRVSSAAHGTIAAALALAGHAANALAVSELAWNRHRDPVRALDLARSCAAAGRIDDALGWIERAVTSKPRPSLDLEGDEALATLREDPRFAELVRRARR